MRLIDADDFKNTNERLLDCDFPYISEMTLGELIDAQPTIEAEPVKRGEWIKLYNRNYRCSACNQWWTVERDSVIKDFDYCPSCGAIMDGEERSVNNVLDY